MGKRLCFTLAALVWAAAAIAMLLPQRAAAQVGPSWSWPPDSIKRAIISFADPPEATTNPIPDYAWRYASIGLGNRDYRDRGKTLTHASGLRASIIASPGVTGSHHHHRRRLLVKAHMDSISTHAAGRTAGSSESVANSSVHVAKNSKSTSAAASSTHRAQRRALKGSTTSWGPALPRRSGDNSGGTAAPFASGDPPTSSSAGPDRRISGSSSGFPGIGVAETKSIPEDPSIAVGASAAIHAVNGLLRFYRVDGSGQKMEGSGGGTAGTEGSYMRQVWAADFFYAVSKRGDGSNGCDQGVFSVTAAHDKWVGRYIITAICDDYLYPKILLAVSTSADVTGYWALYSTPADNAPTSWLCPNGRRAYPDYSQVGYNRDGLFVTWVAICREGLPNNLVEAGAMLYAFPKWAVYGGNDPALPGKRFYVPVWTASDLCTAVRTQVPFDLPLGGDCGAAFTQLQPVVPQTPADVRAGETFFVLDMWLGDLTRRHFLLAALIATGTLWDHDGLGTPSPYLVGRFVDRGQDAPMSDDVALLQPPVGGSAAPILDAGAVSPRGYWNGGAAFANGRIYLADRTDIEDDPLPPKPDGSPGNPYNPRPAVYWAWVQPSFTAYGPCACYWNFNWGYGYGWVWDRACYNPITGVVAGGGGGAYIGRRRLTGSRRESALLTRGNQHKNEQLQQQRRQRRRLAAAGVLVARRPGGWLSAPPPRGSAAVLLPCGTAPTTPIGSFASSTGSSGNGVTAGGYTGSYASRGTALAPNVVYSAAAGAIAYTVRTQAPIGARVVTPPAGEARAAARLLGTGATAPQAPTAAITAAAAAAARAANGTWAATAAAAVSGTGGAALRDVYMAAAYYDAAVLSWSVDFNCRFKADWNVRNTVTLLATIVKTGVVTYGSGSGEAANALGLAYPSVSVRGGTMLVTYTYSGPGTLPALRGVRFPGQPAYPGVGFTLINSETQSTSVNVAYQPDPSFGPILQAGPRFGDRAAVDIHPVSGRVWAANLCVWAPYYKFDDSAVVSTAGTRITVFG